MDWLGDPTGAALAALIGLVVLAFVALTFGRSAHGRNQSHEFSASEPDTTEEYQLHPQDVHDGNDPPSTL